MCVFAHLALSDHIVNASFIFPKLHLLYYFYGERGCGKKTKQNKTKPREVLN